MSDSPLRLHVFPDPWGLNPSPFCLKAETYCRLAGIAFETVPMLPIRAPRGKLPFMTFGEETTPDSQLIVERLQRLRGDPLDGELDAEQRALGHLVRRTCEESLYFVLLHFRWIAPQGWSVMKPVFFGGLPPVARTAVATIARRGVRQSLLGQGYGRFTPDEILRLGEADLAALECVVARRAFAVGSRPTSYDATLYAFLASVLLAPIEGPLKAAALRREPLGAYVARLRTVLGER